MVTWILNNYHQNCCGCKDSMEIIDSYQTKEEAIKGFEEYVEQNGQDMNLGYKYCKRIVWENKKIVDFERVNLYY